MKPRRFYAVRVWLLCTLLLLSQTAAALHWYGHHASGARTEQGTPSNAAADCEICFVASGLNGAPAQQQGTTFLSTAVDEQPVSPTTFAPRAPSARLHSIRAPPPIHA